MVYSLKFYQSRFIVQVCHYSFTSIPLKAIETYCHSCQLLTAVDDVEIGRSCRLWYKRFKTLGMRETHVISATNRSTDEHEVAALDNFYSFASRVVEHIW